MITKAHEAYNKQDFKTAFELYTQLSNEGNADAQTSLAYMCHRKFSAPSAIDGQEQKLNENCTPPLTNITTTETCSVEDMLQREGGELSTCLFVQIEMTCKNHNCWLNIFLFSH